MAELKVGYRGQSTQRRPGTLFRHLRKGVGRAEDLQEASPGYAWVGRRVARGRRHQHRGAFGGAGRAAPTCWRRGQGGAKMRRWRTRDQDRCSRPTPSKAHTRSGLAAPRWVPCRSRLDLLRPSGDARVLRDRESGRAFWSLWAGGWGQTKDGCGVGRFGYR